MIRNDDAMKRIQELLDLAAGLWVDNHSATDLIVSKTWSSDECLLGEFIAMAEGSVRRAKLPLVTITTPA